MRSLIIGFSFLGLVFGFVVFNAGADDSVHPAESETAHCLDCPAEVKEYIGKAVKSGICELESPRRVGVFLYADKKEGWLIRVFTYDGEEKEIWINYEDKFLMLYFPDKIYYKLNGAWIDKNDLPKKEAKRLKKSLKFTDEENEFMKNCFDEKGIP